jgi:hypothetical protein
LIATVPGRKTHKGTKIHSYGSETAAQVMTSHTLAGPLALQLLLLQARRHGLNR